MAKLFGRWDTTNITIRDPGLARYITLETKIIPHSFGAQAGKKFGKAKVPVVERLINKIMRSGQGKRKLSGKFMRGRGSTGKKLQAMKIVEKAFEIIEKKTNKNPIEVFIRALENSAPREDVTRFRKGGIIYTQSVDVAPLRRLDEALKNLALAAFANSFNTKKSAEEALAEEIILASQEDVKSYAVKRRNEIERIAASSR
ncbi:MAG: 30S ribosomal protein S7 [Candidatus Diapherotrites archaeon]|nr:30S ribosomal protein S7 [Candidatus Diapherotrites archaeon]